MAQARHTRTGAGDGPLAGAAAAARRRLGPAFQGTLKDQLEASDGHPTVIRRSSRRPVCAPHPACRPPALGGRCGSRSAPRPGSAERPALAHPPARGGRTPGRPDQGGPRRPRDVLATSSRRPRDVLQHRRLPPRQRGPLGFARGQRGVLVVEPHGLLPLLPGIPPLGEQVVVQPTALRKLPLQEAPLLVGWVQAVLARLPHASICQHLPAPSHKACAFVGERAIQPLLASGG